jgi:hypothetical protein
MIVGYFDSSACAVDPISNMTQAIVMEDRLCDIYPLNLLPDFMVNSYRPKDTILIGIGQPSTLCIAHEDLVSCF